MIFILPNKLTNGFDKTNFCKITETNCFGHYDSAHKYSETCEMKKCSNMYSYQCTKDVCTDKKSTVIFF